MIRVEPIRTSQMPSPAGVDPAAGVGSAFEPGDELAPDLIEPLVAFRRWRAIDRRLRSPYLPVFWDEPVLPARCHRQRAGSRDAFPAHTPPHALCTCGIHAYHEPDVDFPTIDYRGVTGIVTLGGKVEVHPNGMRAEFARVEALGFYSRWSNRQKQEVAAIVGQLGIDLVDLDDLAGAAETYGRALLPGSLSHVRAADRVTFPGLRPRQNSKHLALVP